MAIACIRNLDHTFGSGELTVPVLRQVQLDLQPGEIVLLTGPSGSGKTTLLTLLGALRSPQKGSLRVFGQELWGASKELILRTRRRIGYIFQAQNLHRSLSALQNVSMGLEVHERFSPRERRLRSLAFLEKVGLSARAHYLPAKLSGGQRQRVAIARALVSQPLLVLADEPTASLDGQSGRAVIELLLQLAREQGTTILLVTHDPRILHVADRSLQMEDGGLVSVSG